MKIVERVLSAEENATSVVDAARKKADEMRNEAEKQFKEQISKAREQAQETLKSRTEHARVTAKELISAAKEDAARKDEKFSTDHSAVITSLSRKAADLIITPEYER